ncbi:MAG: cyclase family protein [Ilumatobacteraceae bacterium]
MPLQAASQADSPRVLRRPDVQRLPVERRRPQGRHALLDRQDGQGDRRKRRVARHRPAEERRLAGSRPRDHPRRPRRSLRSPGVTVGSGDILFFRTGWRTKFKQGADPVAFMEGEPGIGLDCCEWLHEREVAVIASDNWAIEVLPGEVETEVLPVHMVLIRDAGMTLGEILDLDELAEDCASDGVYEFLTTAPPIKFTNGRLADQPARHQVT